MTNLHQEYERAAQLQAELDEMVRYNQQKPDEQWADIYQLPRVVTQRQDQLAANPDYAQRVPFSREWGTYFTAKPITQVDESGLTSDVDRLAELIVQAIQLGETHVTFQHGV